MMDGIQMTDNVATRDRPTAGGRAGEHPPAATGSQITRTDGAVADGKYGAEGTSNKNSSGSDQTAPKASDIPGRERDVGRHMARQAAGQQAAGAGHGGNPAHDVKEAASASESGEDARAPRSRQAWQGHAIGNARHHPEEVFAVGDTGGVTPDDYPYERVDPRTRPTGNEREVPGDVPVFRAGGPEHGRAGEPLSGTLGRDGTGRMGVRMEGAYRECDADGTCAVTREPEPAAAPEHPARSAFELAERARHGLLGLADAARDRAAAAAERIPRDKIREAADAAVGFDAGEAADRVRRAAGRVHDRADDALLRHGIDSAVLVPQLKEDAKSGAERAVHAAGGALAAIWRGVANLVAGLRRRSDASGGFHAAGVGTASGEVPGGAGWRAATNAAEDGRVGGGS